MILYGINDINSKMESEEVFKETAKQYWIKRSLNTYNYHKRISKDDPMLAFSRKEAFMKFEEKQFAKINRLQIQISELKNKITNARNALH